MLRQRSFFCKKPVLTQEDILLSTLDSQKTRLSKISFPHDADENAILNWSECLVNEMINKPFDADIILTNYAHIQRIWAPVKSDKNKLRKSVIRLKLFAFAIKGNDPILNQNINTVTGSIIEYLRGLKREDWVLMLQKVNLRGLIEYWVKNSLISKKDFDYFKEIGKGAGNQNNKERGSLQGQHIDPSLADSNEIDAIKNSIALTSSKRDSLSRNSQNSSKISRNSIKSKTIERRRSSMHDKYSQLLSEESVKKILIECNRKSSFFMGRLSIDINPSTYDLERQSKGKSYRNSEAMSSASSIQIPLKELINESIHRKVFYIYFCIQKITVVIEVEREQSEVVIRCRQLQLYCRKEQREDEGEKEWEDFIKSICLVKRHSKYSLKFQRGRRSWFINKSEGDTFLSVEYIYSKYFIKEWNFQDGNAQTKLHNKLMDAVVEENFLKGVTKSSVINSMSRISLKKKQSEESSNTIEKAIVRCEELGTSTVERLLHNAPVPAITTRRCLRKDQLIEIIKDKYDIQILPGQSFMVIINNRYCKVSINNIEESSGQLFIKIKFSYNECLLNYCSIPEQHLRLAKHSTSSHWAFSFVDVLKMYKFQQTSTYSKLIHFHQYKSEKEIILLKITKKSNHKYFVVVMVYKELINKVLLQLYCQSGSTYLQAMLEVEEFGEQNQSVSRLKDDAKRFVLAMDIKEGPTQTFLSINGRQIPLEMVFVRRLVTEGKLMYEQKCFIKENSIKSYPLDLICKIKMQMSRIYYNLMVKDITENVELRSPLENYFLNKNLLNPIRQTPPKISQYRFCRADILSLSQDLEMKSKLRLQKENRFYKITPYKAMKFEMEGQGIRINRVSGEEITFISHDTLREKIPFYDHLLTTDLKVSRRRMYKCCGITSRFI